MHYFSARGSILDKLSHFALLGRRPLLHSVDINGLVSAHEEGEASGAQNRALIPNGVRANDIDISIVPVNLRQDLPRNRLWLAYSLRWAFSMPRSWDDGH